MIDKFIENGELSNIKKILDLKCFDFKWFGDSIIKDAIKVENLRIVDYLLNIGIKVKNINYNDISPTMKRLLKKHGFEENKLRGKH